jgi:hypothetical protein
MGSIKAHQVTEHGMRSHLLWCPVDKVELALLSTHSNSAMQEACKKRLNRPSKSFVTNEIKGSCCSSKQNIGMRALSDDAL